MSVTSQKKPLEGTVIPDPFNINTETDSETLSVADTETSRTNRTIQKNKNGCKGNVVRRLKCVISVSPLSTLVLLP